MTFATEIGIPTKRFTVAEVLAMLASGALTDDEPVELLDGELLIVSPQGAPHANSVVKARRLMERVYGAAFHVRDHSPVTATPTSLPEPDIAVVKGEPRFTDVHPGPSDIVLVLEVADSTLRKDRKKARIYAQAGYSDYWLLNLETRTLEVYSQCTASGEYGRMETFAETQSVQLPASEESISVGALLP